MDGGHLSDRVSLVEVSFATMGHLKRQAPLRLGSHLQSFDNLSDDRLGDQTATFVKIIRIKIPFLLHFFKEETQLCGARPKEILLISLPISVIQSFRMSMDLVVVVALECSLLGKKDLILPVSFDPYYMLSFMLVDKLNVSSHVARGYIYQGYWHFIVKLKL
ncbi:hypothetical protein KY289_029235 [Solanum tuberosum]|nr:hypothetical protein KY289_029235 [Solanum tuberosum]